MGSATLAGHIARPPIEGTSFADAARLRIESHMDRYRLSPREREVAWLLFGDGTYAEIAHQLYIQETTAKNHTTSIANKLRLEPHRRTHSVRHAVIVRLLGIEGIEPCHQ